MRILSFGVAVLALGLSTGFSPVKAQQTLTQPTTATVEVTAEDRVLGNPDAPVTILEYASLTCPHCAEFHSGTLPQLKKDYIDTGKAKLVFRDFPLDRYALQASVLTRCADESRYFGLLNVLYSGQKQWASAEDPMKALQQIGTLAGVSPDKLQACGKDEKLLNQIAQSRMTGEKAFQISGTPTIIITSSKGTEKVPGNQPYDTYKAAIAKLTP